MNEPGEYDIKIIILDDYQNRSMTIGVIWQQIVKNRLGWNPYKIDIVQEIISQEDDYFYPVI